MARLIEQLRKLPGIGAKSAQRLAFHILRASTEDADALADAVRELKARLLLCSTCNNITDVDPCVYCASPTRSQRVVCVVEEPGNIAVIEKTRSYNGVYHVLHGTLSPLHGVGPEHLRTGSLVARIAQGEVEEVILATIRRLGFAPPAGPEIVADSSQSSATKTTPKPKARRKKPVKKKDEDSKT